MKKMGTKEIVAIALMIIVVACIIVWGSMFCLEMEQEQAVVSVTGEALQESMNNQQATEENQINAQIETEEQIATEEPLEKVVNPYRDFFVENEDMVAWLKIEDTNINYPVMQKAGDNDYYLYRDFKGNDDKNGSLILDQESKIGEANSTNLLVHGHNMKSGAIFGELDRYEDEEFCKEHPIIQLHTKDGEHRYEVIAVFRSQVYYKTDLVFKYYNFFEANSEDEFDYFYDGIKELALFDTGVTAEYGDRFITLSTCAYHVEDGRFVVVGKEVDMEQEYLPLE